MEIADALYGVTMRGDGVTQVISQRLREPTPEGAVTSRSGIDPVSEATTTVDA